MKTAIIGGGAAGFFCAINLKEMCPQLQVCIFERSQRVLQKVAVSGGGRCNCTNSFASVTDLKQVYPRGHRLMKRLMHEFSYVDAYQWFESRGVKLVTQEDECVFPASQDSQTIINLFLNEAKRLGIEVKTNSAVDSLISPSIGGGRGEAPDFVVVTTGGNPRREGLQWLADLGHEIEDPCPSLFTFNIEDTALRSLMGTVQNVNVRLAGTKFEASGPLLITHWGLSGPAVLRLSSYAARHLADSQYKAQLTVNWSMKNEEQVHGELLAFARKNANKQVATIPLFALSSRLWQYLLRKVGVEALRWSDVSGKQQNRLASVLTNDVYDISGRGVNKDEFVTCGGVSLKSVNPNTLESRVFPQSQGLTSPRLFFAGEVLDIDGVTGGFNFQAAWTTAYTVAKAISQI